MGQGSQQGGVQAATEQDEHRGGRQQWKHGGGRRQRQRGGGWRQRPRRTRLLLRRPLVLRCCRLLLLPPLLDAAAACRHCLAQRFQQGVHSRLKLCCCCCSRPCCSCNCCRVSYHAAAHCSRCTVCRRCCSRRLRHCCRRLHQLWRPPKGSQLAHSRVWPVMLSVGSPQQHSALADAAVEALHAGCCRRCRRCCCYRICRTTAVCRRVHCRRQRQAVEPRRQLLPADEGRLWVERRRRGQHEAAVGGAGQVQQQAAPACGQSQARGRGRGAGASGKGQELVMHTTGANTARSSARRSALQQQPVSSLTTAPAGPASLSPCGSPNASRPNQSVRVAACQNTAAQGPCTPPRIAGTSALGAANAWNNRAASLAAGGTCRLPPNTWPLKSSTFPAASHTGVHAGAAPRSCSSEPRKCRRAGLQSTWIVRGQGV